jgi:hypothetical protein
MIATEERLRAAMRAAADTVPPGSSPKLRLPDGQPGRARWDLRRRWARAMVPLAAAAAVAAVVIASLTLTRGVPTSSSGGAESSARPVALNGVPAYYIATANQVAPTRVLIRATATGAILANVKPPKPYGTFNFVTAAADDRTFILAAQRWWPVASGARGIAAQKRDNTTPVVFFRLRFDPTTRTARLTALHIPQNIPASSLGGIAVSPDGSRLALALARAQVKVITLATGSARQWIWPGTSGGTWVGNEKPSGMPLSWTASGQTLAFPLTTKSGGITSVMLLDPNSAGGSLGAAKRSVTFRGLGHAKDGPIGNALITPDGSRIVTVAMRSRAQVREFSARTGQPVSPPPAGTAPRPLTLWGVLWTNSSGSTLIVTGLQTLPHHDTLVTGTLRGGQFTPLPQAPVNIANVAW